MGLFKRKHVPEVRVINVNDVVLIDGAVFKVMEWGLVQLPVFPVGTQSPEDKKAEENK